MFQCSMLLQIRDARAVAACEAAWTEFILDSFIMIVIVNYWCNTGIFTYLQILGKQIYKYFFPSNFLDPLFDVKYFDSRKKEICMNFLRNA